MSRRHNEDFLKTHVPEEIFDKCCLSADGMHFNSVNSLVDYLGDDKVVTKITSWNGSVNFYCQIYDVVEFLSGMKG